MTRSIRFLFALAASAFLCTSALTPPAFAQTVVPPQVRMVGFANATASQTFATTSYADLAAATLTFTPTILPSQTEAPATPTRYTYIKVDWSADVIKATTTTGTCAVYVNGAVVAASSRTIDVAAKQGVISGSYTVANTVSGAQTVKLQCKSGDTAVLTVNTAQMAVTLYRGA